MRAFVLATTTLALALGALAPARAQTPAASAPALQIAVAPLVVRFAVAPGGSATTPVTVRNTGSAPVAIAISPVEWHTTVDGDVRTEPARGTSPDSLAAALTISGRTFALAPGETRRLTLALAMPQATPLAPPDRFGGFLIRATPLGAPASKSFGVGANVLAYETVGTPRTHLRLDDVALTQSGRGEVALVARFVNDGQSYVRPQIRVRLESAGRIVRTLDDSTTAIFAGHARRYARTFDDLPPGRYALELTSDYGGTSLLEGTTQFEIR